jgi:deoxyhypusine synthase
MKREISITFVADDNYDAVDVFVTPTIEEIREHVKTNKAAEIVNELCNRIAYAEGFIAPKGTVR